MEEREPDFSIVAGDRLVAYVWAHADGALRRASARSEAPLATVPYAEILAFDHQREALLVAAAAAAADVDAFLFEVQLEGLRVLPGRYVPDARFRRF